MNIEIIGDLKGVCKC